MNMQYWLLIIAYALMYSNRSWCQKISLETSRHSHIGNISQNICPKSEHEVIFPHKVGKLSNLHKNYENDMVELIKHKFTSMSGNRLKSDVRKVDVQDDPNLIQALMSRAFIDNANLAFHKNDIKDEDSGTFLIGKRVFQVNKYSKVKSDLDKPSRSSARGKRDTLTDKTELDDSDEPEDSIYEKRDRLKVPEEEMRIHCVRAGPSEVMCKHDNYTYSFKLPMDLFDKKIMENLVSSVCSIIEEASPEGGGKVELSVKKSYNLLKKERESCYKSKNIASTKSELKERKEDPERVVNKVIRINIPIDFSAIPLGAEDEDKSQSDRSEQELKGARDSDTSTFDKQPNKLTKKTKYQQSKIDDISSSNTDESADNLALMKSNDCSYSNGAKDEYQEKWLNKRDNLQKPMVFPPSLILFKRSPNKLQNNMFNRYSYNLTSCEENGNN